MPDRIGYYMDEHISNAVSTALQNRGVKVITPSAINMLEASDEAHLEQARLLNWVIVSMDADFFVTASYGSFSCWNRLYSSRCFSE